MPIELDEYFQGRDRSYPQFFDEEIKKNAIEFLEEVNGFLADLGTSIVMVNSGYRPPPYNAKVHGSKNSYHIHARAVDLHDNEIGTLDAVISSRPDLLRKWNLWLEDPLKTPGWVHLDNGTRADRPSRTFMP